jgi:PPM family protein phosphatase
MSTFQAAGLSDPGRKRENNEDRFHFDPERGIFFVIDGVGGQAAGEMAADTACKILKARLERTTGTVPDRIREAITLANNEIFRLAQANEEWHGMACVLTVAVVEGEQVHIGQVGDSRLYLIRPGEIRKLTRDHSPVGEREDRGEIDEATAMRHPRRNEVYRDVGTTEHTPDDPDFIEITSSPLPGDGVLLLCSDGLTDLVPSRQILTAVEANAGRPEAAARALIDAANEAGGKDNITVVIVEGSRFAPGVRRRMSSPRTSLPLEPVRTHFLLSRPAFLIYGAIAAAALVFWLKPHWVDSASGLRFGGWGAVREPRVWRVNNDISATVANAQPGDTVMVAPGVYDEHIRMMEGIRLISEKPGGAVIRSNAIAISVDEVKSGRIEGFRIEPDDNMYLQVGIQLSDSAVEIVDNEISGTVTAGIELKSAAGTVVRANRVTARSRAAILVDGDGEGPRITGNLLFAEGHPAVVITGKSHPDLTGNTIQAGEARCSYWKGETARPECTRASSVSTAS